MFMKAQCDIRGGCCFYSEFVFKKHLQLTLLAIAELQRCVLNSLTRER